MAPEVVRGDDYDGRCDWWSIGIILFECLYGHTPFLADEGRNQTKRNILDHESTFRLPSWPPVSRRCQQLLLALITDKSRRLCSSRYHLRDNAMKDLERMSRGDKTGQHKPTDGSYRDRDAHSVEMKKQLACQYVFPYDAEDIKGHKFFKNLPWQHLHMMPPPFIPNLHAGNDTRYFDDGEDISESDESSQSTSGQDQVDGAGSGQQPADEIDGINEVLQRFDPSIQAMALEWIEAPHDSSRLRAIEAEINHLVVEGLPAAGAEALRQFVKRYGRKEKKRPRDRLLRDANTKGICMEVRKRSGFLGYTWKRMPPPPSRSGKA